MTAVATLEERLEEAESALHNLLTGKTAVEVNDGSRTVRYESGKINELRAYISDLKTQIASATQGRGRRAFVPRF